MMKFRMGENIRGEIWEIHLIKIDSSSSRILQIESNNHHKSTVKYYFYIINCNIERSLYPPKSEK